MTKAEKAALAAAERELELHRAEIDAEIKAEESARG